MAAIDDFSTLAEGLDSPGTHAIAVTPSDTNDLTHVSLLLYIGVTGDVTLDTVGGEPTILFKAVPAGTQLKIRATRIRATGTTATNIVAIY